MNPSKLPKSQKEHQVKGKEKFKVFRSTIKWIINHFDKSLMQLLAIIQKPNP